MTEVVAALIWESEKFMICQRPAHKARGLLWEFVGGMIVPTTVKFNVDHYICGDSFRSVGDQGISPADLKSGDSVPFR